MTDSVATETEIRPVKKGRAFVDSRRFAWLALGCALAAGALWYISDGDLGPWPLLLASIPWVARAAAGRFPLPRTRFDPLLAIFLASAVVAAWVSYNQQAAWGKLWLIVGALAIFYALAGQRSANVWSIMTGLAIFGAGVGLYFTFTHDFETLPAKIQALNRIGLQLSAVRPAVLNGLHSLHPNVAGGIMAMVFPFALAAGIRGIRKGHGLMILSAVLSILFMAVGLALTTSRGAWVALGGGLMAWLVWAGAGEFSHTLYLSRRKTLGLAILLLLGGGLTISLLSPQGFVGILDRLPGPASAGSRLEISRDAIDMASDFPFTGGGLGAFDGLYSQYIRVIPHHALIHGHNLYLNAAVEQGVPGFLSLIFLIALAFWWLADPGSSSPRRTARGFSLLAGATFASLVVMCLHGLVEDPLYGSRGVLLLWLPLGLVAFLFPARGSQMPSTRSVPQFAWIGAGAAVLVTALLLVVFRDPVMSVWNSNLAALQMARIELEGYPTGEWSDGREASFLSPAKERFERALRFDRDNRTAWHRLGLIAMLERDYEMAKDDLYNAYLLDPAHRGIRKALAYSYVWTDNLPQAMPLLATLPESGDELGVYAWWWGQDNRPDLSQKADEARKQLASQSSQP